MTQFICNCVERHPHIKIAVFSTEMDDKSNLLRLVSNRTGVPSLGILKGKGHIEEVEKRTDRNNNG